ncbi:MAG: CNNM domain-containing protein, partial [Azovibrio sp.]
MDLWILIFLILASGVLSMAEMAVGASRDTMLRVLVDEGVSGAKSVLHFRANSSRLFATTQLGITALAMLSGIFGESLWVPRLTQWLQASFSVTQGVAYVLALGIVVTGITFFNLVFGEVVPKRLALARPEAVAVAMSG